jgi:hypothetical protein
MTEGEALTPTATATAAYTLREEGGELVISRANGTWVYTLASDDRRYAEELLANLNGEEA